MKANIIGNWKLVSFKSITEDNQILYPYGEDAVGYLTYTDQDFMSVSIMRSNRMAFEGGDIKEGTIKEKTKAIDDYLTYCGKFTIREDKIVHLIELSLFPNWIGQAQERFFKLKEDMLELSTAPFLLQGKKRTAHLLWKKI